nr:nucleotidyl transferase AbiEii/AbiGii toxin family protein [Ensifer canadensis]
MVAEKFEALVTLGMANSRLKDFYDLWLIAETFEFEWSTLAKAVRQTFARRGTDFPKERPMGLSDAYAEVWDRQWRAFLGRERMAVAPPGLATVVGTSDAFCCPSLGPVMEIGFGSRVRDGFSCKAAPLTRVPVVALYGAVRYSGGRHCPCRSKPAHLVRQDAGSRELHARRMEKSLSSRPSWEC